LTAEKVLLYCSLALIKTQAVNSVHYYTVGPYSDNV